VSSQPLNVIGRGAMGPGAAEVRARRVCCAAVVNTDAAGLDRAQVAIGWSLHSSRYVRKVRAQVNEAMARVSFTRKLTLAPRPN